MKPAKSILKNIVSTIKENLSQKGLSFESFEVEVDQGKNKDSIALEIIDLKKWTSQLMFILMIQNLFKPVIKEILVTIQLKL